MTLNDRAIRNYRPEDRPYKKYDAGGLYIIVNPNGSKWWRFKYRFGGKAKLLSFGVYPDIGLADARERRDAARKLLARRINPSEQRKKEQRDALVRDANSFEAVAREWHSKQARRWSEVHAGNVLHRLEKYLFPEFGGRPISEIEPPELLAAVRKLEERGVHDVAHRTLGTAGQVFRYGVAAGRCTRDPSADLRGALTPHVGTNHPAIKPAEMPDLLRAIDGYTDTNGGDRKTALGLRLICLTFLRTKELIGAEWTEFLDLDRDEPSWEVPGKRMKMTQAHIVPLSRQAVAILKELRAMSGDSRYMLPGRNPDKPISNNTLLFALYRLGYKGKMTGHGFRAVASTALNENGWRPDVVERQLAHKEPNKVRAAYNRAEYLPERRKMMQAWADMVDAYAKGADVVPIKRRAKS